tara:strand:- start:883 stop:1092 length:210 start_codon:yes stop_codon:yes gene_type:complete
MLNTEERYRPQEIAGQQAQSGLIGQSPKGQNLVNLNYNTIDPENKVVGNPVITMSNRHSAQTTKINYGI